MPNARCMRTPSTLASEEMSCQRLVGIAAGIAATAFVGITQAATPVILISVDTLRADRLGAYGYKSARTPNIDALAHNGTLFAQAGSQISLALPSQARRR